ncbi:uncharacterized protein BDW70DRAFT_154204 [Aspergillus foveolatus]|uniref:uncharacterized protein n=1 Tax=Aspergillus foveolatus TaxID=210207 RepID=UPI003CCDBE98
MSVVRSQYSVTVPATGLLSYIFESLGRRACGYSIDQIKSLFKSLGNGLHHLRARGKRVMVYGEANIQFVTAVLVILAAGAEVNFLVTSPPEYLVSRIRQLKCDIVLLSPEQADIEAMLDAAGVLGIPHERLFHCTGLPSKYARRWFIEWPRLSPDETKSTTAVLLYTSGTTGTPKLACRTHYGLVGNIAQALNHYTFRPRCKEIVSYNYKFAGIGFLLLGIMIPLKARYKSIFPARLDLITFAAIVDRFKPTWVMAPPHLMRATLAMPATLDFGSVKHVLTGGSFVSWKLVQSTYGMTEADTTTGILLPNAEAKILDERGVYIRTPFVMKGYLDEPTHTAQTVGEDGWINTGAILDGLMNGEWITQDLFKIRGDQITGSEIETAVSRHPGVRVVAVIPVVLPAEYPPRMQLTGGAVFTDAIPISNLIGNSKVDRRELSELAGRELQLACMEVRSSQVEA